MSEDTSRTAGGKMLDWLPVVLVIAGLIWDASAAKQQATAVQGDVQELKADMKEVRTDIATLKAKMEK